MERSTADAKEEGEFQKLIHRYNRHLLLKMGFRVFLMILGYLATYFFFYLVVSLFPGTVSWMSHLSGWLACIVVSVSVFCRKGKAEPEGKLDSFMASQFSETAVGAAVVNHLVGRVTGPALLLSGLFELGPQSGRRLWDYWRSFLPSDLGFCRQLAELETQIYARQKWHELDNYLPRMQEISALVLLDLVDLDLFKGRLKTNRNS